MNKCKSCDEYTNNSSYCNTCVSKYNLQNEESTELVSNQVENQIFLNNKYTKYLQWLVVCLSYSFLEMMIMSDGYISRINFPLGVFFVGVFVVGINGIIISVIIGLFTKFKNYSNLLFKSTSIFVLIKIFLSIILPNYFNYMESFTN